MEYKFKLACEPRFSTDGKSCTRAKLLSIDNEKHEILLPSDILYLKDFCIGEDQTMRKHLFYKDIP